MRIWDIHPGYLNRQSLLGEHRELHGMVSIFLHNKKGYSKHPETLRWSGFEWALKMRHELLKAEMILRGYNHHSPISLSLNPDIWPLEFIDEPHHQFELIEHKYIHKEQGRIPLPSNTQILWAQHKYSVMARDVNLYSQIGKEIAQCQEHDFKKFSLTFVQILRTKPSQSGIRNALNHMWGYLCQFSQTNNSKIQTMNEKELLQHIQTYAIKYQEPYILASTALSELDSWIEAN